MWKYPWGKSNMHLLDNDFNLAILNMFKDKEDNKNTIPTWLWNPSLHRKYILDTRPNGKKLQMPMLNIWFIKRGRRDFINNVWRLYYIPRTVQIEKNDSLSSHPSMLISTIYSKDPAFFFFFCLLNGWIKIGLNSKKLKRD